MYDDTPEAWSFLRAAALGVDVIPDLRLALSKSPILN